jgi:hypothetical protein
LAIENYPQIKHSCGVWGLFRDDSLGVELGFAGPVL